jgi:hypothetical protein
MILVVDIEFLFITKNIIISRGQEFIYLNFET